MMRFGRFGSKITSLYTTKLAFPFTPAAYKLSTFSGLEKESKITAVLGAQWGDEGKGKLVDILAGKSDVVGRFNGGSNAGHTLVVDNKKYAFHLLPCGMLYPEVQNVIGNGVVLHLPTLMKELEQLSDNNISYAGRLHISNRAHLLFDFHQIIDGLQEKKLADFTKEIGTTRRGIGPCYSSKITRNGLRVGHLTQGDFSEFEAAYSALLGALQDQFQFEYNPEDEIERFKVYREFLREFTSDTIYLVNNMRQEGKRIVTEGANAALLDIDFGTYPFVTSSSTTVGGISTGLGLPPRYLDGVIGVVKAYTTRVGGGPFPTELGFEDTIGKHLASVGHEFGTTTGRPRRCGWLDIPVVQYSHAINGYDSINITKLDVLTGLDKIQIGVAYWLHGRRLSPGEMPSTLDELAAVTVEYEELQGWGNKDISKARKFEDLPKEAQAYLLRVEELAGVPISWIGVGPGRAEMATKGF